GDVCNGVWRRICGEKEWEGRKKENGKERPKSEIQEQPTKHKIRTMMPCFYVKGLKGKAPCREPTGFSEP
ncbi:hypothetical protein VIGAN_01269200, partial [Vigna angularis var. angularis]